MVESDIEEFFKEQGGGWFYTPVAGTIWQSLRDYWKTDDKFISLIEESLVKPFHINSDTIRLVVNLPSGKEGSLVVHSLRFPDGRQWDAVNGFRE